MTKKRFLSLLLVLSLVLSTFVPVLAVETSPQEELFNTLVEKFGSLKGDAVKMFLLAKAIDNKDTLMQNIEAALDRDEAAKNILLNNGINKDKVEEFILYLRDQLPKSLEDIKEDSDLVLVRFLFDDAPEYSNYASDINTLVNEAYDIVPVEVKEDLGRYADTKDGKIGFLQDFINEFLNSKIGTATYDVGYKKYIDIDLEVSDDFLSKANGLLSNPLEGETRITLTGDHINSINALLDVIVRQIKDSGKIDDAGYILVKAGLVNVHRTNEPTDPGTDPGPAPGGGGGGGGGGSAPSKDEPKEPTVPTDPEKPVTVELDRDSMIVEIKDGVSTVTVDEKALTDAVKQVADAAKKAGEGRGAEVVLQIEDTTDANLNVVLPSSVFNTLKNSNVNLVVKSNNIEYSIPAGLLLDTQIPEGAIVEFKSKEVAADSVKELAEINGDAKKVVEFSLEIVTKDGVEKVNNLSKYLTIKISTKGLGDPDRLVVYYVNEGTGELEFISGKVKDGMLVMSINHYSKYAVVERNVTFTDAQNHWAKKYIESMAAKHIVDGIGGELFDPNAKVTRSQFVKLLVGALELEEVKYNGEFADIKASEWYSDFVATAVANGLIDGYTDGTFRPNNEISRLEMAVMLSRALKDVKVDYLEEYNNISRFADNKDIADWAKKGVAITVKSKLMEGVTGNRFAPNEVSNRAEAATVIYRLFNR